MIGSLLLRAKSIPHRFVVLFFSHAFAVSIGMAIMNSHATKIAIDRVATDAANREAAVGVALIEQNKQTETKLKQAAATQKAADADAYQVLAEGMADAEAGRAEAELMLAKEFTKVKQLEENADALKAVNKMLAEEFPIPEPPAGCNMPPSVRRVLDANIARNNAAASGGDPEAAAAAILDGAAPNSPVLTCEQLAYSVNDILEHDALLAAWVQSWQAWAKQALR